MATLNLQVGANASDGNTYYTPPSNNPGTPGGFNTINARVGCRESGDGYSYNSFFHFSGVSGLSGATINSADFQVYAFVADVGTPETLISAEDEASPAAPTTKEEHDGAARTTANVPWDDCNLNTGAFVSAPDIAAVIQELADSYDPDEIVILWDDDLKTDSENYCQPTVHNSDPAQAAKLDIDYTAAGGITVTPPTATLTTSTFAPVIKLVVTPGKLTLSLATFTPVLGLSVIPPPLALSLTAFAPTVTTTGDVTVTPGVLTLTLAEFAPVIKLVVTPPTLALNLQTFAPTISTPRLVTPPTASLSLAAFAPTVSAPRLVTPGVVSLSISLFAPTVTTTGDVLVTPGVLTLSLGLFAPTVSTTANVVIIPGVIALSLTAFVPAVTGERKPRGGMSPRFGAPPGWAAKVDERLREPVEETLGRI